MQSLSVVYHPRLVQVLFCLNLQYININFIFSHQNSWSVIKHMINWFKDHNICSYIKAPTDNLRYSKKELGHNRDPLWNMRNIQSTPILYLCRHRGLFHHISERKTWQLEKKRTHLYAQGWCHCADQSMCFYWPQKPSGGTGVFHTLCYTRTDNLKHPNTAILQSHLSQ